MQNRAEPPEQPAGRLNASNAALDLAHGCVTAWIACGCGCGAVETVWLELDHTQVQREFAKAVRAWSWRPPINHERVEKTDD